MSRLCLDTSAYSHFMRGQPAAIEALDQASWVGVPVVAIGELRTGFLLGHRTQQSTEELAAFIEHPVTEVLPVDADIATTYAELVAGLRSAGTPLPTNDIWIAASAVRHGATIVTYDAHFAAMPRVAALILEPPQD